MIDPQENVDSYGDNTKGPSRVVWPDRTIFRTLVARFNTKVDEILSNIQVYFENVILS